MQIVQELCKRPGLNRTGFDMPTIYIPNPNKPSRCANQVCITEIQCTGTLRYLNTRIWFLELIFLRAIESGSCLTKYPYLFTIAHLISDILMVTRQNLITTFFLMFTETR